MRCVRLRYNVREISSLTLVCLLCVYVFVTRVQKEHFAFSGGDIIFLLRNAIFKGTGEVSVRTTTRRAREWSAGSMRSLLF